MAVSFAPKDAGRGGLKDDFRGVIVSADLYVWPQSTGKPVIAGRVFIQPEGEEDESKREEIRLSLGNKSVEYFDITDDGDELVQKVPGKGKVNDNCNFSIWMREAQNAGIPESVLESGKMSTLVGYDMHWKRQSRPAIDSDPTAKKIDILVPIKKYADPGTGTGAKKTGNGVAAGGGELESAVQQAILSALQEAPGNKLVTNQLSGIVWKAFDAKDPRRTPASQLALQTSFLSNGPWKFDGKKELSL